MTNAAQTARQGGGYRCATWPARRHVWAVVCGALLHARWRTRAATATKKNAHFVAIPACVCVARQASKTPFCCFSSVKNGVCSHFCFSNYLTSSLDREGAPGDPPASRIGRVGGASLLHSRGSGGASKRPPGIKLKGSPKGLLRGGNLTRVQGRYNFV